MIDKELLDILACPESKEPVYLAHASVVEELNGRIEAGGVANRGGKPVEKKMDGGLVREDGAYLYPIEADIPIMLIDEAIPIGAMGIQARRAAPPE
ncbi:MAG: Trm112 family protein [Chloroflexi bacterium]|nr:Trm112 family protein [Chloroflexota bacterium]